MKQISAQAKMDPRVRAALRSGERPVYVRDAAGRLMEIRIAGLVCRRRGGK